MRLDRPIPRKVLRTGLGNGGGVRRVVWTAAVFLMLGAGPRHGSGGATAVVLQLLRRGQVRLAHRQVVDRLTANPDDADLHALYGAVLEQMGHHSDADMAFRLALGSDWYEARGLGYHAAALAHLGRPEESVAIRQGIELTGVRAEGAELGIRLKQVEDLLAGGRPDLALELGEAMVGEFPSSPLTHAQLVEVLVELGQVDLAGWHLIRAESLGASGSKRVLLARARWLMAAGAYRSAWDITEGMRRKNPHDVQLWSLRMRILRLWGRADDAVLIAELDRFITRRDPIFLLEAARCYVSIGDLSAALAIRDELMVLYGDNPNVQALDVELGNGR